MKWINSFYTKHRWIVVAFVVSIFITGSALLKEQSVKKNEVQSPFDSLIPAGFVYVPIEVQNADSLDSVFGQNGIVDLYVPTKTDGGKMQKIASRIPLIRAPLNPNKYAALVPETEVNRLVQQSGNYFVVVQNPKQRGMQFDKTIKQKKRRLEWENTDD